ncbi:MAG: hypothetical protein LBD17_02520 [Endomicrobium sp.]|jgi:hypothetical protein|nr:hypothetical protein [Endomicrobium sp.]
MKNIEDRLFKLKEKIKHDEPISIMILGLGSVGMFLLDYLISYNWDVSVNVVVVGRNLNKMEMDVNIVKVASLIRGQNKCNISIQSNCDFNNVDEIAKCIAKYCPDLIVNSSRVYPGLKYGSISWSNLRAYGIWTPLAVGFIRNIMQAYERVNSDAIVINTSYSDTVIAWIKTSDNPYPDFGSGNLNHLVPRIKLAISEMYNIEDFWNIKITLATSHFHDVVISKEGHTENVEPLLSVSYKDDIINVDTKKLYTKCKISMPTDSKRNMMNASSNFEIINSIVEAVTTNSKQVFHSPGAFGYIGGYPICIDGTKEFPIAFVDESIFSLNDMINVNKKSIALDGVESIKNGTLTFTDVLINKVKAVFNVELAKYVPFDEIDKTSHTIIDSIIKPNLKE